MQGARLGPPRYARRAREEDEEQEDMMNRWEGEVERKGDLPVTEEQRQTEAIQSGPGLRFGELDTSSFDFDEDGLAQGMVEAPNATYIGQMNREGSPHGMGRFIDNENNTEYTGEWRDGRQHGWGKLVQADGDVLEGQWDRGVFSGEGRLSQPDGSVYDGQWQWSRPYGEGRLVLSDGTVFEGVWGREQDFEEPSRQTSSAPTPRSAIAGVEDEPKGVGSPEEEMGIGTIRYPNRARYEGEWRALRPHGTGELKLEDGSEYKGQFEDGLFHGVGRLRYANRGEYEGRGRMLHPDGKVEVGHWKRDRLIEVEQDKEHYMDAAKGFVQPERHKRDHERGVPGAKIVGPAEPRGKWAGRHSGAKKPFDLYGGNDMDEDEEEEEDFAAEGRNAPARANEGLTQGKLKSTSHTRWAPLKGRGRN